MTINLSTEQLDNFIVFEGMDGSGQDTQAALLADELMRRGYKVVITYEPSKEAGILGSTVRNILQNKPDYPAVSLQVLIIADRVLHVEQIRKLISEGCVVISVRYLYSNIVYGQSDGIPKDWTVKANSDFPRPRMAIYLDLPVETSLERVRARGQQLERYENSDHLAKVKEGYEELIGECPEMKRVDAALSVEEVGRQVVEVIDQMGGWPVLSGVDSQGRCL